MIASGIRRCLGRLALAAALFLVAVFNPAGAVQAADRPAWQSSVESCRAMLPEPAPESSLQPPEPDSAQTCDIEKVVLGIDYFCPEETAQLMAHPWASLLAREREALQLSDLEGFYQLSQGYAQRTPGTPVSLASLAESLAALDLADDDALSFWQRVWQWLKDLWGDRELPETDLFKDFSLSENAVKAVMFTSLGLIILTALVIIVMEVRAAGFSRRRLGIGTGTGRWRDAGPGQEVPLTLEAVRAAPLREQPGLLLLLLLKRLADAGQLQVAASYTHRDIAVAAKGLDDESPIDQSDLVQLSTAAERAAFGGWQPGETDVSGLWQLFDKAMAAVTRREAARPREHTDG